MSVAQHFDTQARSARREGEEITMALNLVAGDLPRGPGFVGYLYELVADEIEKRIAAGDLEVGTPFPNERQLAEQLETSLGTARRAVEVLRERGLVVTLRSKGTFVVSRERREPMPPEAIKLV
jgi:GntR family transcriptional regulator